METNNNNEIAPPPSLREQQDSRHVIGMANAAEIFGPSIPVISRHESYGSNTLSPTMSNKSDSDSSQQQQLHHPSLLKSQSIPINGGSRMKRTLSEEKLCDENNMAEYRDYLMFRRIVDGIAAKQQKTVDYHSRYVNDMCLANIFGARNMSEEELNNECDDRRGRQQQQQQQTVAPINSNFLLQASASTSENLRLLLEESYHEVKDDTIFDLEL